MSAPVSRWRKIAAAGLAAASLLSTAATGQAADYFVRGVYASDPGICGNTRVLGTISNKFAYQVRHVPNLPQVDIVDFRSIRQNSFIPAGENRPIERRYCMATVMLSDGLTRTAWYLIEHPMGFAGIGSNVEFCVLGFDRWKVYGGDCRVLRMW